MPAISYSFEQAGSLQGGPVAIQEGADAFGGFGFLSNDESSFYTGDGGATFGSGVPSSNIIPIRNGLKRYKVQKGDTLSSIAAQFTISLETLRYANQNIQRSLHVGEELLVLPVSGALYEALPGDSVESLALKFGVSEDMLRKYNPDLESIIAAGSGLLVLPGVKPQKTFLSFTSRTAGLPDLKNYFALPAQGWNWGELHEVNAVDIANKCGTDVYAAQEGLVIPDEVLGDGREGWNNGYGIFVLVEHPNGTKTRYAHLDKALVRVGDYVEQGNKVGIMGNTGNTHGPTGCHLHFEVYGAKNPFAVK